MRASAPRRCIRLAHDQSILHFEDTARDAVHHFTARTVAEFKPDLTADHISRGGDVARFEAQHVERFADLLPT